MHRNVRDREEAKMMAEEAKEMKEVLQAAVSVKAPVAHVSLRHFKGLLTSYMAEGGLQEAVQRPPEKKRKVEGEANHQPRESRQPPEVRSTFR